MSKWKSDFDRKYNLFEKKQNGLIKKLDQKAIAEYFYRKGRNEEREAFRIILSDTRSALTRTLIHLKNVFAKYKSSASKDDGIKIMLPKEEKAFNKIITEVEDTSETTLEIFKQGEDE